MCFTNFLKLYGNPVKNSIYIIMATPFLAYARLSPGGCLHKEIYNI